MIDLFRSPDQRTVLITALVSGMIVALSFPPLPFGFCAPLGVALLMWTLTLCRRPFSCGLLFGIGLATCALYWIGWVTIPGVVALILIDSAGYGLLAIAHTRIRHRFGTLTSLVLFPGLWLVLEAVRGIGDIGFPWLNLAHTQLDYLWLYQFVEFTGDLGLSFWVVSLGCLIYGTISQRRTAGWVVVCLWIAAPAAWGAWRVSHLPAFAQTLIVGILQADIDTYRKWDDGYIDSSFILYDSLTRLVAPRVDLVIWPETAAPTYLGQIASRRNWAQQLSNEVGVPILIGTLSYRRSADRDYIFNSAYEVSPGDHWEGPYSKQQLVPFGEMIPGARWFPILETLELGQGNFWPGPGPFVFDSAGAPHSVLICFESAFSSLCREQILKGARFLVIITNDSWYGRTSGPAQHAALASLRAVEFRVGVARAANGGISLWTDRAGRRMDETGLFTKDVIVGTIELGRQQTFYARHGLWILWITGAPGILMLLASLRKGTTQ